MPLSRRKKTATSGLEREAPDTPLPQVTIRWTARELENLAALVSAEEAPPPTEALIRAMRAKSR